MWEPGREGCDAPFLFWILFSYFTSQQQQLGKHDTFPHLSAGKITRWNKKVQNRRVAIRAEIRGHKIEHSYPPVKQKNALPVNKIFHQEIKNEYSRIKFLDAKWVKNGGEGGEGVTEGQIGFGPVEGDGQTLFLPDGQSTQGDGHATRAVVDTLADQVVARHHCGRSGKAAELLVASVVIDVWRQRRQLFVPSNVPQTHFATCQQNSPIVFEKKN